MFGKRSLPPEMLAKMKQVKPEIAAAIEQLTDLAEQVSSRPFQKSQLDSYLWDFSLMRSFDDLEAITLVVADRKGQISMTHSIEFQSYDGEESFFDGEPERSSAVPQKIKSAQVRLSCRHGNIASSLRKHYHRYLKGSWGKSNSVYAAHAVQSRGSMPESTQLRLENHSASQQLPPPKPKQIGVVRKTLGFWPQPEE